MISVIVVVYEQATTLRAALQGLMNQTYQGPLELIVSDDGSASDIGDVIKTLAPRLRGELKYVWQPHRGFRVSAARNNGIRVARGDLLVFLDGDMLVASDFLAAHAACHDGSPTIVCGTRRTYEIEPQDPLTLDLVRRTGRLMPGGETVDQLYWAASREPWMAILAANFSVPASPDIWFDEHFRGWGAEDRELAYRLTTRHGYRLVATETVEAAHVRWASKAHVHDPFITGDPHALVEFIANKLYLRDRYPDADLSSMLNTIGRCYLDPEQDCWRLAPPEETQDVDQVLARAREWFARRPPIHTELLDQTTKG